MAFPVLLKCYKGNHAQPTLTFLLTPACLINRSRYRLTYEIGSRKHSPADEPQQSGARRPLVCTSPFSAGVKEGIWRLITGGG